MKRPLWITGALILAATTAFAQSAPTLKQRGKQPANPPVETQASEGFSTLPANASGEYQMSSDDSSVVQMTVDQGKLTGYITKMSNGVTLTLFFTHTTLSGSRVTFTTATIHSLHYSFKGEIVRGDAPSPDLTGFFALTGELTEFQGQTKFARQVNFPSTPRTSSSIPPSY